MSVSKPRRERPPLTPAALNELALRYVGRFATTRAKLRSYLHRKVRERGWSESVPPPDVDALAERFAERGYVDDASYALSKSRSLSGRGYGKARLMQSLRVAGVGDDDAEAARAYADNEALAAAVRYAQRRRIGPFAAQSPDPKARDRALAAMVRAGHSFALSRAIIDLRPGAPVDVDELEAFTSYSNE